MIRSRAFWALVVMVSPMFAAGCIPEPPAQATDRVVLNDFVTLNDGASTTYKVPAGTYRLELTATNDGATARWYGALCQAAPSETTVFDSNCTLVHDAQLKVENPTFFGLGRSTSVTVKLTRVG